MTTPDETSLEQASADDKFDVSPSLLIYLPYYLAHGIAALLVVVAAIKAMAMFPPYAHPIWIAEIVIVLLLIAGIFGHVLRVQFTRYILDGKRLTLRRGVLGRSVQSLELFRIQDVNFTQNWWQELLGIGHLIVLTSDQYHPQEVLVGVRNGMALRDTLTGAATIIRRAAGIRELTVGR